MSSPLAAVFRSTSLSSAVTLLDSLTGTRATHGLSRGPSNMLKVEDDIEKKI